MKKRIKVSSAKAKGRRLQQWVCQKVSDITGFDYGKDCPIESRPMGQSGEDVRLELAVREIFPYSIECKAQESWSIHQWIEQAKENSKGHNWIVIAKKNREPAIAILRAEVLFDLIKKVKKRRRTK